MRIQRITLRNFRAFRDVVIDDIPPFCVIVGANGVGKSTLFDVFGFLKDCLDSNVRQALNKRGKFREVVSRGFAHERIVIELKLRMNLAVGERTVTYRVEIADEADGPVVAREVLQYTRFGGGKPYYFIDFASGAGTAIVNEGGIDADARDEQREEQRLDSPDILAIKGLGQFQRFEAASQLRSLIENWHVSDFHIAQARIVVDAGHAEHLSPSGDNLPLVAQHIYERHPTVFAQILETLKRRVPGVSNVEATETADGRVVLRFQDGSFQDPFISRFVSDGTIKMFAYLLLLYDPKPLQLLCVEEPENQLYVQLLQELAEEFHSYARRGGQVFVTTHSPDFLDAVPLASIFVVRKRDGFSAVEHPADSETLRALAEAGDPPGALWRQGLLDAGLA